MKVICDGSFVSYTEVGQTNPLRWKIFRLETDGNFYDESGWLKCKDFFNDWVYTRETKKGMSIYGFSTHNHVMKDIDKEKPGYIGLKNLRLGFFENLKVLNSFLPHKIGIFQDAIWNTGETWKENPILEIPTYYLKNTYRISLLSLLIRLCNIEIVHSSWKDFVTYRYNMQDQNLFNSVKELNLWFNFHPKVEKYIWYCGNSINSETLKNKDAPNYYIHNNGVVNWGVYINTRERKS